MREDMTEVFHNRPRAGSRWDAPDKGKKRAVQRLDVEDLPTKEGMDHSYKYKNYHSGPIRRFLRSSVGKKWDDIYKEFAEVCDHRNWPQRELLEVVGHDGWYVDHNIQMIDGIPHDSRGTPIASSGTRDQFYVHPETKTLEIAKPPDKRKKWHKWRPKPYVKIDELHQYHEVDGIWYLVEFKPYKDGMIVDDILASKQPKAVNNKDKVPYYWNYFNTYTYYTRQALVDRYGAGIYPVKKTQCGKKALKFIKDELEKRAKKAS